MKKQNSSILSFLLLTIIVFVMTNQIVAQKPKADSIKTTTNTKIIDVTTANEIIDSLVLPKLKLRLHKENAIASYYHDKFNNRKTASGVRFDNAKLTAAHKKLPFGTKLRVTNPTNKKKVVVIINDRGPYVKGREIDLSKKAFMMIATNKSSGIQRVTIEIIEN